MTKLLYLELLENVWPAYIFGTTSTAINISWQNLQLPSIYSFTHESTTVFYKLQSSNDWSSKACTLSQTSFIVSGLNKATNYESLIDYISSNQIIRSLVKSGMTLEDGKTI